MSTFLFLFGFNTAGGFLLLAGSLILAAIMLLLCRLQSVSFHYIMAAGALSLLAGNILFLMNTPVYQVVGWWLAFPLLTIFGERLELNRIMRPPARAVHIFIILITLWIIALAGIHLQRDVFWSIASVLVIVIAVWLIRYDIARKTIKSAEWTRYSAWGLLTGYGWLIAGGLLGIVYGLPPAGFIYDAILHIYFVGFVFSMIFAHAAIIIPSLTGRRIPWSRYFYVPMLFLHLFLIIRVAGDLAYLPGWRDIGSYGNTAAILLFLGGVAFRLATSGRKQ